MSSEEKALFGIMRVRRDLPKGSNVGMLYTERDFADGVSLSHAETD